MFLFFCIVINIKRMKKIVLIFTFIFTFVLSSCKYFEVRSFYCLSDGKCVTVWKKGNNSIFIILGKYTSAKIPSDNYVKISNNRYDYIHLILSKEDKFLIDIDEKATVIKRSSNNLIELYKNNKTLNDSLYTYFDGKYWRYKNHVEFISINIEENYATDKTGKKIK